MINSCTLVGHIVRDAEVRKIEKGGKNLVLFTLAVNHSEDYTSFIECTAVLNEDNKLTAYLKKGKPVAIVGFLIQNRFDAKDGTKKSKLEVRASHIDLLNDSKGE